MIRLSTLLTCHSGPKKYLESGTSSKVGPERLCKLVHYGRECTILVHDWPVSVLIRQTAESVGRTDTIIDHGGRR